MEFTETALLASIDHTLASVRAALYAAADPEQLQEAQALLAEKAGEDTGHLVSRADESAREGDLREIERRLAAAREMLGGPSA
jgi:lactam utilization protein B